MTRAAAATIANLLLLIVAAAAHAQETRCEPSDAAASCVERGDKFGNPTAVETAGASEGRPRLLVFWGIGCRHCEEARPFVDALAAAHPSVDVTWVEIRRDPAGRKRFLAEARRLGVEAAGTPMFVIGDVAIVGFRRGVTEAELQRAIEDTRAGRGAPAPSRFVELPLFGRIDTATHSLVPFTVLVGLADGINPCAFYVLVALLGILLHVRSRRRLVLYGGVFVVMSGVVYFLFMTAWLGLFMRVGISRWLTLALGAVLVIMGLINLKEIFWFKKGVSLVIPEKAKPGLFRRMRAIANAASLPAALAGITVLAFVVNLVELGCTLGLPAVYTRVLSLHRELSTGARYGYLILYNVVYVVPLAIVVAVYVLTLRRLTLSERGAKVLKTLSGLLLVGFGAIFLFAARV
jgi:hypothetical protein